jgi:hypothetical protein
VTAEATATVTRFGQRLADLGFVTSLHVGGSLATGDYRAGVSDLDLVAVTGDPLTDDQRARLRTIHAATPPAMKLGCCYVPAPLVAVLDHEHTTWTHGQMIRRPLSGLARAELGQHGYAVFGPEPTEVWPGMTTDEIRCAARQELDGYWTWASRRPWLWLATEQVDLAVTTMLRARHTVQTGELITKSAALSRPSAGPAPARLLAAVRARRDGASRDIETHLVLDAVSAWRLTRRTIAASRDRSGLTSPG